MNDGDRKHAMSRGGAPDEQDAAPSCGKKRRIIGDDNNNNNNKNDNDDDDDDHHDQPASHHDEIARLQKQVDQLKKENVEMAKLRNQEAKQAKQVKDFACSLLCRRHRVVGDFFDFEENVPAELKKDGDIVASAVNGGHLDWWSLSDELKYDPRVAALVISMPKDSGWDREFLNSMDITELSPEKPGDVMLAALLWARGGESRWTRPALQKPWHMVPQECLRIHKGLAMFGMVHRLTIAVDECPCLLDRDFMKVCVEKRLVPDWDALPTELRNDIGFARSIRRFRDEFLVQRLFENFPDLCADRDFWGTLMDSVAAGRAEENHYIDLFPIIEEFAPAEIVSDRELMVDACAVDEQTLEVLDVSFTRERNFLFTCVDRNPFCIAYISREVQRLFPDVVDRALFRMGRELERSIEPHDLWLHILDPSLWDNRAFVLRWFQYGLPFLSGLNRFREEWRADEEIFLSIARNCSNKKSLRTSFSAASTALCNNKKFMLRALQFNPLLIEFAGQLINDFDLCLIVFSDQDCAREEYHRRGGDEFRYIRRFHRDVKATLAVHETFCSVVLPAISCVESVSTLALLNQGTATSVAHKRLIAEYLGVPIGKQLRQLRLACRHLDELKASRRKRRRRRVSHPDERICFQNGSSSQRFLDSESKKKYSQT